jgi:hypothetical protein
MTTPRLVNREQLYVSISRGRLGARIYTNDAEALRLAVRRDPKKEVALDAVKQRPTLPLKPQSSTINLKPQQSQNQSAGIRIRNGTSDSSAIAPPSQSQACRFEPA